MGDIWEAQALVSAALNKDWSELEQPPLSFLWDETFLLRKYPKAC